MEKATTLEQLREMRASMPNGKKDPWLGCCGAKRSLINRALRKKELSELTAGELAAVKEWVTYIKKTNSGVNRLEQAINKVVL